MSLARRVAIGAAVVVVMLPMTLVIVTHLRTARAEERFPPIGGFLVIDETWLHCLRRGAGEPVVLLHGNPGSVRDFLPEIADVLASRHDLIACDRPGHGFSERPLLESTTPADQAWLVRGALREMGVERSILVGHSWGGALALLYALEHPGEVSALVLLGSRAYAGAGSSEEWLYRLVRAPYLGSLLRHTLPSLIGSRRVEAGLSAAYAPEAVRPGHLASARALWIRPGQVGAMAWDTRLLEGTLAEIAPAYRRLDLPVEIVVGEYDPLRPESERLARDLPGARLTLLEGAGHHLPQSRPGDVIAAIERAAERVEARRAGRPEPSTGAPPRGGAPEL